MSYKDNRFSIDDAFENDSIDDCTRLYGSTNNRLESNNNARNGGSATDGVYLTIHIPSKKSNSKPGQLLKVPEDALSKDSESLIEDTSSLTDQFNPENGWWNHPSVKSNWKTVIAAFALLFIGLAVIIAGIFMYIFPQVGIPGFVFFTIGAFLFIPGAYHVVFIYFASRGQCGFYFHNLPVFD